VFPISYLPYNSVPALGKTKQEKVLSKLKEHTGKEFIQLTDFLYKMRAHFHYSSIQWHL